MNKGAQHPFKFKFCKQNWGSVMRLFSAACSDVSFQDAIETFNTRRQ